MTKPTVIAPDQAKNRLDEIPGWSIGASGVIERRFEFKNFKEALLFVNSVGWDSEQANHHPDITINWNKVSLSLITHDAGGLTDRDFGLARKINERALLD